MKTVPFRHLIVRLTLSAGVFLAVPGMAQVQPSLSDGNQDSFVKPDFIRQHASIAASGETVCLTDSVLFYEGSALTMRVLYTYNAQGLLTEAVSQTLAGGIWTNANRYLQQYDGNGNNTEITLQNWVGGAWVNHQMAAFVYDGAGNVIEEVNRAWSSGAWLNQNLKTYVFNQQGLVTEFINQVWHTGTASWRNNYRTTYVYNGQGSVTQESGQTWNQTGSAWNNVSSIITFTYDGQGNLTLRHRQTLSSGNWTDHSRTTLTYDGQGNLLTETKESLQEVFDGMDFVYVLTFEGRFTHSYDGAGNRVETVEESYIAMAEMWYFILRATHQHNEHGYTTVTTNYHWNSSIDNWSLQSVSENHYECSSQIVSLAWPESVRAVIFPNPSSGIFNLDIDNVYGMVDIRLTDVLGRRVRTVQVDTSGALNHEFRDVTNGVYMLEIVSSGARWVQRVVVR